MQNYLFFLGDWKDGTVANNTCRSCRETRFISQLLHDSSKSFVTALLGDLLPSLDLCAPITQIVIQADKTIMHLKY